MQNANLSQEMPQEERSRTIPDTPRRSAELAVAPADIIERAAQRLDWTIAFGMRHNTPRVEGTTNELSQSDPPLVRWTSRLRFSRVGLTPLPAISRLCFMSVLAAGAVGASIFMLTQPPREKATAESAPAEEALATTREATSSSEGLAMAHHAADAVENAALAGACADTSGERRRACPSVYNGHRWSRAKGCRNAGWTGIRSDFDYCIARTPENANSADPFRCRDR